MKGFKTLIIFFIGIVLIMTGVFIGGKRQLLTMVPVKYIENLKIENSIVKTEDYVFDTLTKLKLELTNAHIKIEEENRKDIVLDFSNAYSGFKIDGSQDVLEIKQESSIVNQSETVDVIIKVPNNFEFEEIEIDVGVGLLTIDSIKTHCLLANVGTGELKIYDSHILESMDIDCGIGNVYIEVDSDLNDFGYEVDCGMGNVVIGDDQYSGIGESVNKNQSYDQMIQIDCGMGNVEIKEE